MINQRIVLLIAGLFLIPCMAQADTKPQDRSFSIERSTDAFETGIKVGALTSICAYAHAGYISSSDAATNITALVDSYSEPSYPSLYFAMGYIKKIAPDCFQMIPSKLQPPIP